MITKDTILQFVRDYAINSPKAISTSVSVSSPFIDADDIACVVSAALDGWFTEKSIAKAFENELQKFIGLRNSVLCNSGSSANLLAISACKELLSKRKYVLTSALAFPTTVFPIIQSGYTPLFIDVNYQTLNPNPDHLLDILQSNSSNIAGVILTHTLGFPIGRLWAIASECEAQEMFFIEDCCDALGSTCDGKHVGTFGDAMTLSFFPAHHITTGEGGAVLSKHHNLMSEVRKYNNWGRDCWCLPGNDNTCKRRFEWEFEDMPKGYDHKYTFTRLGYNLKMTELQAALGLSQMDKLEWFVERRKENYKYLLGHLLSMNSSDFIFGAEYPSNSEPSPFGFPITVYNGDTNKVIQKLESSGIRTRRVFAGNITRQPVMKDVEYEVIDYLGGADYIMNRTFWVGIHPSLNTNQLDHILEVFDDIIHNGVD